MRAFLAIVALMLLVSLNYALWEHSATILVQDSKSRPIPHAQITVTYQASERDQQHKEVGYTDFMGLFSINMTNYVQSPTPVNYLVTATAEYGAGEVYITGKKTFDIRGYPDPVPIALALYRVRINAINPSKWPVAGTRFYLAPWTLDADPSGSATFILPAKTTTVVAVIGDVQVSKKITIKGDSDINVTIDVYRLSLRIVDQRGTQRPGVMTVGNSTFSSDSQGIITFNPFPGRRANVTVTAGGRDQRLELNVYRDTEMYVSFDFEAPNISDVTRQPFEQGKKTVLATIADEGKFASGLHSVLLYWSLDGVAQQPLEMYPKSLQTFTATLPAEPENVTVSYYVRASDKQGNAISSEVQTYGGPVIITIPQNNQTNQTGGGWSIPSVNLGQINWWFVIGIGAIAIIAIVVYIYIRED